MTVGISVPQVQQESSQVELIYDNFYKVLRNGGGYFEGVYEGSTFLQGGHCSLTFLDAHDGDITHEVLSSDIALIELLPDDYYSSQGIE